MSQFKYFPERKMKLPLSQPKGRFLDPSEIVRPAGIYKYPYTDLYPWNWCKTIEDFRRVTEDDSYYIDPVTLMIEKR